VKVVEHNNLIFFEAEQLINAMIDNLSNTRLNFEVFGDELGEEDWVSIQENMRGYAAAIKVIIDSYREITPRQDRADFMGSLSEQIDSIMNAPRTRRLT